MKLKQSSDEHTSNSTPEHTLEDLKERLARLMGGRYGPVFQDNTSTVAGSSSSSGGGGDLFMQQDDVYSLIASIQEFQAMNGDDVPLQGSVGNAGVSSEVGGMETRSGGMSEADELETLLAQARTLQAQAQAQAEETSQAHTHTQLGAGDGNGGPSPPPPNNDNTGSYTRPTPATDLLKSWADYGPGFVDGKREGSHSDGDDSDESDDDDSDDPDS